IACALLKLDSLGRSLWRKQSRYSAVDIASATHVITQAPPLLHDTVGRYRRVRTERVLTWSPFLPARRIPRYTGFPALLTSPHTRVGRSGRRSGRCSLPHTPGIPQPHRVLYVSIHISLILSIHAYIDGASP